MPDGLYEPGFMSAATAAGIIVRPWTVDDPGDMRRFMLEGAQVITNVPDVALKVRAEL